MLMRFRQPPALQLHPRHGGSRREVVGGAASAEAAGANVATNAGAAAERLDESAEGGPGDGLLGPDAAGAERWEEAGVRPRE